MDFVSDSEVICDTDKNGNTCIIEEQQLSDNVDTSKINANKINRTRKTLSVLGKITKQRKQTSYRKKPTKLTATSAKMSLSRSPTPEKHTFQTTADVHQSDIQEHYSTNNVTKSTDELKPGNMSLIDYWRLLYVLVPIQSRIEVIDHTFLALLNRYLLVGEVQLATLLRSIHTEWQAWKRQSRFQMWKQRNYSIDILETDLQDLKWYTMLYRFPGRLTSADCQALHQALEPLLNQLKNKEENTPLLLTDIQTTSTSFTDASFPTEVVAARGATLYDFGITDEAEKTNGLAKLFGSMPTTSTTSGICWTMSAEAQGEYATFVSAPQSGYNVVKLDIYDYKKCVTTDKSSWWKDAIIRSVAVTTDNNDPIQRLAERLANTIATRLANLNPEKKSSGHNYRKGGGTNFSRSYHNI